MYHIERTLDIVGCLNDSTARLILENTRHGGVGIFGTRLYICSAQSTCLVNTLHSNDI